jgi:hypothetical protein
MTHRPATGAPACAARSRRPWHTRWWTAGCVPQHLPDLGQRRPGPQHLRRQRVPQPVRAHPGQPGPPASPAHDLADRRRRQPPVGGAGRAEHCHRIAARPARHQIGGDRLADLGGQRQPFEPAPLAADRHLAPLPVDVGQLQGGDLGAAQAKPRQHEQDRVVAAACHGAAVAAGQQPAYRRGIQATGQRRQPPARHRRHRRRQWHRHMPGHVQEPQQRPHRRHHRLRRLRVAALAVAEQERGDLPRIQPGQRRIQRRGQMSEETAGLLAVAPHGRRRQAPLPGQPAAELCQQGHNRVRASSAAGLGNRAGLAQEPQHRAHP